MHQPLSKYNIGDNVRVFVRGDWVDGKVTLSKWSELGYNVYVRVLGEDLRISRWSHIQLARNVNAA